MLVTRPSSLFKKSGKRIQKRGKDWSKMEKLLALLMHQEPIPTKYRDQLTGNFDGCRECHIEPDWLLIYRVDGDTLLPVDTGSHADLFG